ncbi:Translation initiation factor 2B subunit, eIF-2Balpha/beta/delta family [Natranaeroarchaeum sulfidigenes]|uniref:Translation initiation factor 2B subunit, eIF-2Balpha/beta/delta family n=2 Tax=Natranaeroarchaeum sulfidigenes TaxID=2784880 RepID=A0A897MPP8_9EURY|nr:Translation initiation factor 2B subunit, eIF-2Balpha/beta/delta family [Natranaeroarchaeum sulfidigenes]
MGAYLMGMADERLVEAVGETANDIARMETRGAVAIATAAADALATQAIESQADSPTGLRAELADAARLLHDTRPTAVSLANALRYVLRDLDADSVKELEATVVDRATTFHTDVEAAQAKLGEIGANRLQDGDTVMTHCHSTDALACVEAAVADGKEISAIVKETRPRNQGHIAARELREMGVPVTLIVDSAARRHLPDVDHVVVGADSIAADGSVINKVGTSGLAVLAREQGSQIMVAAATIKLHPDTLTGSTVEIEQRAETEVLGPDERAAIEEVQTAGDLPPLAVDNPAFDVTPPRYVDAIVTERGQFPPESIVTLMRELFGESVERPWEPPAEIVSRDE